MRRRWIVAMSLAMAVAAVCGFVVAHDARSWRDALKNGDAAYARAPARARWTAQTWLPGDPVGRAMGVPRDVSLRRAVQLYVAAIETGRGLDAFGRELLALALLAQPQDLQGQTLAI